MASIKSFRTVQQMQPLLISTISSREVSIRSPSIPSDQNSFSTIAIFLSGNSRRMLFRSVVFPDQRNPVRIVMGIECDICKILKG